MFAVPLQRLKHRFGAGDPRTRRQTYRDWLLARRLLRTFERDLELTGVHGLHFYVQNGNVTLKGNVQQELDRDVLVSLVRQIPGVKGVLSELRVDPHGQAAEAVIYFSRMAPPEPARS